MKFILKLVGYTFLVLIGLVVIALVAVQFISDEQYKTWITGAAQSATGRELVINGEFDVNLGSRIGLLANDVSFGNADWGSRPTMVTAERLFAEVRLLPLFKGVLDVTLEVDTPDILLETDTDGIGNWAFGGPEKALEAPAEPEPAEADEDRTGLPLKPYLRNVEINNLSFVYDDKAGGRKLDTQVEQFRVHVEGQQIPIILKALYQGAPIDLQGSLGNVEQWHANEQTAVALSGTLNDAKLTIEGTAGPVLPEPQADLDVQLSADSVQTFSAFAGSELPDLKGLDIALSTAVGEAGVSLDTIGAVLQDPRLAIAVKGKIEDLTEAGKIDLTVTVNSDTANELFAGLDQQIPYVLPPTVKLNAAIQGDFSSVSVRDLDLQIKDEGVHVSLTGGLENVPAAAEGAVDLELELDSTDLIGRYIGQEVPSFGPVTGEAHVVSSSRQLQLDSLNLDLADPLISVKVSGSASEIGKMDNGGFAVNGIAVTADIVSDQLEDIAEKLGIELPGALPESFTLTAKAAGNLQELALENLQATVTDEDLDVNLTGTVENLIGLSGVEANLAGSVKDTSSLAKFAGVELPGLGSLDLKGQVTSTEDSYRLNGLDIQLMGDRTDLKVQVSAADLLKLTEINAVVEGKLETLAALSELTDRELPRTGPWNARITADTSNLWESPLTLSAKLGGEGVDAALDAQVPTLREWQTFDVNLGLDVASIARLLALIDRDIPEDKPLKLVASASGKPGEYRVEDFSIKAEDASMTGNLTYLMSSAGGVERNNLTGKLALDNFDFTPLLAAREAEAEAMAEAEAAGEPAEDQPADEDQEGDEPAPEGGKKVFSDEPFKTGPLRAYDVDLEIAANNVIVRDGIELDGNTVIKLDNGNLSIDPFQIEQSEGGAGTGYVHLDTRTGTGVLDAELHFDKFVSPRFGGLFDLDLDLDSSGKSVAELMGNLNGYFAASVKDVELRKSFMSQFGAGLLQHLNPLDSEKTLLECGVVRFDVEDGMVDFHKKIAAQTLEVTWVGGGEINLKTEELDVGISPKARGALSSLTNIDLASLVHVGGTLAEPKIGVDLADVAKKYAGYSAFIATGGLSFLAQKLVETQQANVDQCERILKGLEEEE